MLTNLMPVLFMGHGSPMNAIEDNEYSRAWAEAAQSIPPPKAILCISAHWETRGAWVTAMDRPRTIYDFGGFPRQLYEMRYPAPGSPDLADLIIRIANKTTVQADQSWGLDHGTWSVLCRMFPKANIPVIQLSLDRTQDTSFHFELGHQLQDLRNQDVLIIGSGNIVHNLRVMSWEDTAFDWAVEYDGKVKQWILDNDPSPIIGYEKQGRSAALAVNSAEHYLPLLYILGLRQENDAVSFFADKITAGSISMRCVRFG